MPADPRVPSAAMLAKAQAIDLGGCACDPEINEVCDGHRDVALALDAEREALLGVIGAKDAALERIGLYTHNAREQHADTFFSDCPATACCATRAALALTPAEVAERAGRERAVIDARQTAE